jgi:hypothetical protein
MIYYFRTTAKQKTSSPSSKMQDQQQKQKEYLEFLGRTLAKIQRRKDMLKQAIGKSFSAPYSHRI